MKSCPTCKQGSVRPIWTGAWICNRFPLCTYEETTIQTWTTRSSLFPDYVVFDFETTGLSSKDKIIEIGAAKVKNGQVVDQFEALIYPGFYIDMQISRITGIENKDLEGKPDETKVIPAFLEWLEDTPLLMAHNLPFDARMLVTTCRRLGLPLPNKEALCTLQMAKKILPNNKTHKLGDLCAQFQIPLTHAHRAIYDVLGTQQLFEVLKQEGIRLQRIPEAKPLQQFCKNVK